MRLTFLTATAILIPALALAAPTAPAPVCIVTGKVTGMEKREAVYENQGWAQSWGLPESQIYIDVTLSVNDVKTKEDAIYGQCSEEAEQVFQLGDDTEKPEIGACIEATTHFSGDEFRIGNWIKGFERLEDAACAAQPVDK